MTGKMQPRKVTQTAQGKCSSPQGSVRAVLPCLQGVIAHLSSTVLCMLHGDRDWLIAPPLLTPPPPPLPPLPLHMVISMAVTPTVVESCLLELLYMPFLCWNLSVFGRALMLAQRLC